MAHLRKLTRKASRALFLAALMLIAAADVYGGDKMEPLYDLSKAEKLEPQVINAGHELDHLFPVPRDNALGTTDLNNAITLIRFKKDRVAYDEIAADFLDYVSDGVGPFLPVFDPDTIAYAQTRGFVVFNLKTKAFTDFRICYPIEETIEGVAVADAAKRQFLFYVEKFPRNSNGSGDDYTKHLRLMDLSGDKAVLIKEVELPMTVGWFTAYDKVFLYDKSIAAYTSSLEQSHHPLVDVFNQNKDKIEAWMIHAHPYLPFAIISGRPTALITSWGKDIKSALTSLFQGKTLHFEFSPDGKWVVFQKKFLEEVVFYLMPVSEKYPHYLGSPIKLFDGRFNMTTGATGWTNNPISYVGADDYKLLRWELTSKAYPQAGKADFHDWIVEKDLEKLKAQAQKEKK